MNQKMTNKHMPSFEIEKKTFLDYKNDMLYFFVRKDTCDHNDIYSSVTENEYQLDLFDFQDDDVVIDIGAHIGGEAIVLAANNPGIKIYSFEPIWENIVFYAKNREINNIHFSTAQVFHRAVKDFNGRTKIFYGDMSTNTGKHHMFIGMNKELNKRYRTVRATTLESIFVDNKIHDCKLLKIDCEGEEKQIFASTPKMILEKIDWIVGEHHNITRQELLDLTKDVFIDMKCDHMAKPPDDKIGHFKFKNKRICKNPT